MKIVLIALLLVTGSMAAWNAQTCGVPVANTIWPKLEAVVKKSPQKPSTATLTPDFQKVLDEYRNTLHDLINNNCVDGKASGEIAKIFQLKSVNPKCSNQLAGMVMNDVAFVKNSAKHDKPVKGGIKGAFKVLTNKSKFR